MSTQRNEAAMTDSDEILVCSGCGLPFRRNPEGLLVHLEPWCAAMVNGGECPRPVAAKVALEAIHEEPNDAWQHIAPPDPAVVAMLRDLIAAGREVSPRLLWPEGGSDDSQ